MYVEHPTTDPLDVDLPEQVVTVLDLNIAFNFMRPLFIPQ